MPWPLNNLAHAACCLDDGRMLEDREAFPATAPPPQYKAAAMCNSGSETWLTSESISNISSGFPLGDQKVWDHPRMWKG